jgi:phosphohistidine phosphatase
MRIFKYLKYILSNQSSKMNRHLYIIRHAEAEDGGRFFGDFERELTPSGIMAAARMGKLLFDSHYKPDSLVCSAAKRAHQTAKIIAEQLHFEVENIVTTPDLYENGPKTYLAATNQTHNDVKNLVIVGHNPDVSFFAEYLTKADIGSLSTGSVVVIEFTNLDWNEVGASCGKLVAHYSPD